MIVGHGRRTNSSECVMTPLVIIMVTVKIIPTKSDEMVDDEYLMFEPTTIFVLLKMKFPRLCVAALLYRNNVFIIL